MYCYGRLRDLREDADMTQKQIGALLNTTQQQYAKYERGVQEIPTHHLVTLAEYYNVSMDYLVGRADWTDELLRRNLMSLSDKQRKQVFHEVQNECGKRGNCQ